MKTLLIKFCERSGSSAGVRCVRTCEIYMYLHRARPSCVLTNLQTTFARDYLQNNLVAFAKHNPQIEICTSLRPGKHPTVMGAYIADSDKSLSLKNMGAEQVLGSAEPVVCCEQADGDLFARYRLRQGCSISATRGRCR